QNERELFRLQLALARCNRNCRFGTAFPVGCFRETKDGRAKCRAPPVRYPRRGASAGRAHHPTKLQGSFPRSPSLEASAVGRSMADSGTSEGEPLEQRFEK